MAVRFVGKLFAAKVPEEDEENVFGRVLGSIVWGLCDFFTSRTICRMED